MGILDKIGDFIGGPFGSPPKPPKAPDPVKLIKEQAEANRISMFTPEGDFRFGTLGPQGQFVPDLEGTAAYIDLPPAAAQALAFPQEIARILGKKGLSRANELSYMPAGLGGLPKFPAGIKMSGLTRHPGAFDTGMFAPVPGTIDASRFTDVPSGIDTGLFAPLPGPIDFSGFAPVPRGIDTGMFATVPEHLDFSGLTGLPGIDDFGAERSRVEQAQFDRLTGLLNPVFEQREAAMRQRLANRGLPIGSEAFEGESTRFDRGVNEAMLNAANQSVLMGGQEQSRLFGMALGARQQQVGEAIADAAQTMGVRSQQFSEALADANQAMAARGINLQEALAQANLGLAGRDTNLREALAAAEMAFRSRGMELNESIAAAAQAMAARGIDFQEALTQHDLQARQRAAQFNEQLTNVNLQRTARQQMLAERLGMRSTAFNELAAMMGMQQVQQPQFTAPGQIDVLGPYAQQYAGQLAGYDAAQRQREGFMGGLFDLGSAMTYGYFGGLRPTG